MADLLPIRKKVITSLLFLAIFNLNISSATVIDFEDMSVNGYDGMIIYQNYFEVPLNYNVTFDNYTEGSSGMIACTYPGSCTFSAYSGSWMSANPDYSNSQLTFVNPISYFEIYAKPKLADSTLSIVGNGCSYISGSMPETWEKYSLTCNSGTNYIWLNHSAIANRIAYDNLNWTKYTVTVSSSSCYNLDFSGLSTWDIVGHLRVILYWLYNAPNCYLSPFWDFFLNIINTIYSAVLWVVNAGYNISVFIISIGTLITSIISLIVNTLYDVFATNVYSSITFSIILMGISLVFSIRIYNIIADMHIFGWKLPKL